MPGMLTCEELDGFLYDFHEGNLSPIEKLKFKLHLSICSECRKYVNGYKNTISTYQAGFSKADQIDKIPEDLMQAILKSREPK